MSSSSLLATVISINGRLGSTFLPTLPLPLAPCIHAARVSLAYWGIRKRIRGSSSNSKVAWVEEIAGYLVMAWGGGLLASYLSLNIPPQLLALAPWQTYLLVHLYIGLLLRVVAPSPVWIDTLLPLLDGAIRTFPIAGGVNMAKNHSNPAVAGSLLFQIILGTVAASGGGQLAGTLGIIGPPGSWTGSWKIGTPPILKARSLVDAIDVVAAFAGAVAYSLFSGSHSAWTPLLVRAGIYAPAPIAASSAAAAEGVEGLGSEGAALKEAAAAQRLLSQRFSWSDAEARAMCTLVVAACFAWKAVVVHWMPARQAAPTPTKAVTTHAKEKSVTSKAS